MQQPSWVIQDRRLAWGGGFVKMIFPIKGSTGSAVVSVFATKEAGKYVIRQLGIQTVFGNVPFPTPHPICDFVTPCSGRHSPHRRPQYPARRPRINDF
jgi:hypothetical protein